jgi:hypothetical protein
MRNIVSVIGILVLSCGYFRAQGQVTQDSIYLGDTKLTLGMPKDAVITALASSYEVISLGEGQFSSWGVSSKSVPPFKSVGNVVFREGS